MAVTENLYTGNGSTVLYSFTFPYLATSDIKVTVNGTLTTAYTFANATTIQFNTAPANGAAIRIYRETDSSSLSAQFYPGSAIRSQDLNDNFTQNLYVTQEIGRDQALLEAYVDATFVEDTRVHFTGDTWSNTDDYNIPTVQAVSDRLTSLRDTGFWDSRYYTESELNAGQLDNRYFTESELLSGIALDSVYVHRMWFRTSDRTFNSSDLFFPSTRWIDTYYYTKDELDAGQLDSQYVQTYNQPVFVRPSTITWGSSDTNVPTSLAVDNRIIQLKDAGVFDDRYFTETESDARYYNINTESIKSTDTWTPTDGYVATTAAIEARIITLVDDVGGFVPIPSYTSFPTNNPDPADGAGTVVSIQNITGLAHSGGTSTNATTTGAVAVSITGIPAGLASPVPDDFGMLVITTSTLNTYTFHRLVAPASDVVDVASNATNINTVAGQISPTNNVGTVAGIAANVTSVANNTANINAVAGNAANINTVAGINSNVTTVAGISTKVTTVANNDANVTAVANNAANITTVAGSIANVNNVGGSIANVNTVATNVADVNTVATDIADVTAVSTNIGAVAAVGADLANSFSNIDDFGGITDPVTSTPGGTSDIQTVAADIADVSTVAGQIAPFNNVGAVALISNQVSTVAGSILNVVSVSNNVSSVNTVAGNIANVNAVGANIASVNTAATNIAAIIAAPTAATNAANSASAAATSETNAAASATNAATSASAAATSESNAATSASNASSSATAAAASASDASASAANALVSEQNADASEAAALKYRDQTSGYFTQAESTAYNVAANDFWGDLIIAFESHFANEGTATTKLTMSSGSNTYNYGTII